MTNTTEKPQATMPRPMPVRTGVSRLMDNSLAFTGTAMLRALTPRPGCADIDRVGMPCRTRAMRDDR